MKLELTARRFYDLEAKDLDLVTLVFYPQHELDEGVRELAQGWFLFLNLSFHSLVLII